MRLLAVWNPPRRRKHEATAQLPARSLIFACRVNAFVGRKKTKRRHRNSAEPNDVAFSDFDNAIYVVHLRGTTAGRAAKVTQFTFGFSTWTFCFLYSLLLQ